MDPPVKRGREDWLMLQLNILSIDMHNTPSHCHFYFFLFFIMEFSALNITVVCYLNKILFSS